MTIIKIFLLLRPPATAAAVDEADEEAVDDAVVEAEVDLGEVVTVADSCAAAELITPTADAAPLMKALRGFVVVVVACPYAPAALPSAMAAGSKEWNRILQKLVSGE